MFRRKISQKLKIMGLISCMCLAVTSCGTGSSGDKSAADVADSQVTAVSEASTSSGEEASSETAKETDTAEDTQAAPAEETQEEVPILYEAVEQTMGAFVGCAATQSELEDEKVWEIITTHFNAITFGNELKPDALVGYSVTTCPGTETTVLNGEEMEVPILNYSRAEAMLDKVYDWNQENPDRKIMVRGHVLVWHSQTPEWFFHEDYDKNKPYVDKETMNKRLEWYIKTVLTHFTGEDSKYKDMFYGWDVVNEAISDGTGTYRTDVENPSESLSEDRHGSNSSWWHVYESNEYIINAFKYANKYAPADLELYYNDYNECTVKKRNGILELLNAVKEQEGASGEGTRISAMGMQGHYGMDSPGFTDIQYSAEVYSKAVGKVQLTELDISASSGYTGQEDQKEEEYEKLRKRYSMIYFALKNVNSQENAQVQGITFWGTVDHYSWLQSRSNVGGGNTTGLPQCPLLFDENYEPKSAFYVFANTN